MHTSKTIRVRTGVPSVCVRGRGEGGGAHDGEERSQAGVTMTLFSTRTVAFPVQLAS